MRCGGCEFLIGLLTFRQAANRLLTNDGHSIKSVKQLDIRKNLELIRMNLPHRWLCSSPRWKQTVTTQVLPWALEGLELGSDVLEVGSGYGFITDQLYRGVEHLTCVEIDKTLADNLRRRTEGRSITVMCESATEMSLADETFDGAVSFTMLHHVPSFALQNQLLADVARILRPSGIFAGADSHYTSVFELLHLFDTMVVVEPTTFSDRLRAAGFENIQVDIKSNRFRFRARKPSSTIA
jgi:SAM-dependent methyltransferase